MEFLNIKEIDRLTMLTKVKDNLLTQVKVCKLLGVSDH